MAEGKIKRGDIEEKKAHLVERLADLLVESNQGGNQVYI